MGDNITALHTERKILEIWNRADPDYVAQQSVPRNLSAASYIGN
jgi:hypothetical protein